MSKKHGFRGTPVRPSPRPGTMGRVFETRGDPLVSPKEGQKNYGRNLETENPDYDRFFAPIARDLLKPEQVDKTRALGKLNVKKDDPQRRATAIVMSMRKKMNRIAVEGRSPRKEQDGVLPDNLPKTKHDRVMNKEWHGARTSREEQTPKDAPSRSYYDFTGKSPPKEVKKNGKIYRRK